MQHIFKGFHPFTCQIYRSGIINLFHESPKKIEVGDIQHIKVVANDVQSFGWYTIFSIIQTCSGNPYCWLNTHENHTPIPSVICPYMSMHVRVRTNMRCHHFWICQLRLDDGIHHRSVPVFPKQLRLGEPFPATERSLPRR